MCQMLNKTEFIFGKFKQYLILCYLSFAFCLLFSDFLWAAWVDADGTGQESINISNNAGDSRYPSLCFDTSGNPHIAWSDATSGNYAIYYLYCNGSAWVDADGTGQESINISNSAGSSYVPFLYLDVDSSHCLTFP